MPPRRKKRKLRHAVAVAAANNNLVLVSNSRYLPLEIWEMILSFVGMHDLLAVLRYKKTWKRSGHMMIMATRSICAQLINRMADHVNNVAKYYDLDENKEWKASGNINKYHLDHFTPPVPAVCVRNAKLLQLYEMVSLIRHKKKKDLETGLTRQTEAHYVNMTQVWIGMFMKTQGLRWYLKEDVTLLEIDMLFGKTINPHKFSFFSLWTWMPCFASRLVVGIRIKVTEYITINTIFNSQYMITTPWSKDGDNSGPSGMSRFLKEKMIKVIYYLYNFITKPSRHSGSMLAQKVVYFPQGNEKRKELKIL